MASKIETKLLNMYHEYVKLNGEHYPTAVNVLVRHANGAIDDRECVLITKDGKPTMYGTQVVADISEVAALCSPIDILPEEFGTREEYEHEVELYKENEEDELYYFPNHRFGFTILDIRSFLKLPIVDEENVLGRKEVVEGGIKYTPEQTDQGYVFKDYDAIEKRKGICYIAECGFDEGDLVLTPDNTWEEINKGAVVTYASAADKVRTLIRDYYPKFAIMAYFDLFEEFVTKITDYILQEVDWQCFGTMLNELDMDEDLSMFLADKFVEFAKKRIVKDKDDTDISDDNAFRENLFGFLGDECYMHEDFSLTDWDSLIDKWEDEPNY